MRSAKYYFGVTLARGNRPYNEDAYQAGVIDIPNFSPIQAADTIELDNTDDELAVGPDQEPAVFYFGVFDGHGGDEASSFLKNYMHRYIEESSKLLNPENRQQPAVLTSSRDDPLAIQVLAVEESPEEIEAREKRKHMQTELVNTWKDTVGGYFRRFKPDFGGVKRCGRGGDFGIESVLMYAFLKADLDFITSTRPWFLSPYEPEPVGKSGPGEPRKSGSTATVVLLSTS